MFNRSSPLYLFRTSLTIFLTLWNVESNHEELSNSSTNCPKVFMWLRVEGSDAARGTTRVKVRSRAAMFPPRELLCVGVWEADPGFSLLAHWRNIQIFLHNVGECGAGFGYSVINTCVMHRPIVVNPRVLKKLSLKCIKYKDRLWSYKWQTS